MEELRERRGPSGAGGSNEQRTTGRFNFESAKCNIHPAQLIGDYHHTRRWCRNGNGRRKVPVLAPVDSGWLLVRGVCSINSALVPANAQKRQDFEMSEDSYPNIHHQEQSQGARFEEAFHRRLEYHNQQIRPAKSKRLWDKESAKRFAQPADPPRHSIHGQYRFLRSAVAVSRVTPRIPSDGKSGGSDSSANRKDSMSCRIASGWAAIYSGSRMR